MNARFAIPGFQPPDAPKEHERVFTYYNEPFRVVFLKNIPVEIPTKSFIWYLNLESGNHIEELALSFTDRFVYTEEGEVRGTINYYVLVRPDELSILPGVYALRVSEGGIEIFRKLINVQSRSALCPLPPPGVCPRNIG